MEQVCVGVDIGGTSVKLGIFTLSIAQKVGDTYGAEKRYKGSY